MLSLRKTGRARLKTINLKTLGNHWDILGAQGWEKSEWLPRLTGRRWLSKSFLRLFIDDLNVLPGASSTGVPGNTNKTWAPAVCSLLLRATLRHGNYCPHVTEEGKGGLQRLWYLLKATQLWSPGTWIQTQFSPTLKPGLALLQHRPSTDVGMFCDPNIPTDCSRPRLFSGGRGRYVWIGCVGWQQDNSITSALGQWLRLRGRKSEVLGMNNG